MSAPLSAELRTKHSVRPTCVAVPAVDIAAGASSLVSAPLAQVRAVPIRKDDEVNVVRGTYKARGHVLACHPCVCGVRNRLELLGSGCCLPV